MYISWAHENVPKVSGALSFLINILLIYLVLDEQKMKLGSYKVLLVFFSIFNLISTLTDLMVPVCVLDHGYAFSIFISGGIFEMKSKLATFLLSFRCGIVSAAYGILHSHFVYRYLALFQNKLLTRYFYPYGFIFIILYCAFPLTLWTTTCYLLQDGDEERRVYMEKTLRETYNANVFDLNILVALYKRGSEDVMTKSWAGTAIVSVISIFSVITDIVLGALIIQKLKGAKVWMSEKAVQQQKQFMNSLIVQVVIPMFVSFLPCLFAWYKPMFNLTFGSWLDAVLPAINSFFPALDPLALFIFVPLFRTRLLELFKVKKTSENNNS